MGNVAVVGSINYDTFLRLARFPQPGETVVDAVKDCHPGGKGANQSVAAVAAGADQVTLIAAVGDDPEGQDLRSYLMNRGVNVSGVKTVPGTRTGAAFIVVNSHGENMIMVAPGANYVLQPDDVPNLADFDIVVSQLEVPTAVIEYTAAECARLNVPFMLNYAPALPLPESVLANTSVLVANELELVTLLGLSDYDITVESAGILAHKACEQGPDAVVITLGAQGPVFADGNMVSHVAAPKVRVVDTTGAGDAFVGGLAAALSAGASLQAAVTQAVNIASLCVQHPGAQLPVTEMKSSGVSLNSKSQDLPH